MGKPHSWQSWLCLFLLFLALPASAGQSTEQASPQAPPQPPQTSEATEEEVKAERRVTAEEAEELFSYLDNILAFVSEQTGLAVRHPVKRQLSGRQAVQEHIEERLADDEDAQRLQRSELVLKKFGLLPRDFDLRSFLITLMREQVAGFYNFRTQTVHLLDWVELEAQLPLMAHELTHAVQDQNFPLEEWIRGRRQSAGAPLDPQAEIESDESVAARQAVVEGQAMVVLVNFLLAPAGRDILDSPDIVAAMQAAMNDSGSSPVFASAPLYIREALTFPYQRGLDFVITVMREKGREQAFRGLLENPPRSTRQILMPETYLSSEQLSTLPVPEFGKLLPAHEVFDAGAIGQLDVSIMLRQYGMGTAEADTVARGWRHGYYYAARSKSAPGEPSTADLALVFVSRFATPEQAEAMMRHYGSSLDQRYERAQRRPQPEDTSQSMTFSSEEGDVRLEVEDSLLLVTEGVDHATHRRIARAVRSQ